MNSANATWCAAYTESQAERTALENLSPQGYLAYLFAGVGRTSIPWRPILSTFGVSRVVRSGDEPTPVPDAIIDSLCEREAAGAFKDMIGRLVALGDQERVVILLELLGRQVCARVDLVAVEAT